MVEFVLVCRNLYSAVLLRHKFFWLTVLYHCQGILEQLPEGDVQSGPVADNSCRSSWGNGVDCLVACGFKEKREDMSNRDRWSADTLRVSAIWVDVMCMSKWATKNVRILHYHVIFA